MTTNRNNTWEKLEMKSQSTDIHTQTEINYIKGSEMKKINEQILP